jgi:predicted metal-dependent hydrolase
VIRFSSAPLSLLNRRFAVLKASAPQSDPSHMEIAWQEKMFRIRIVRRRGAKRMTLRLSQATGQATLMMPGGVTAAQAKDFVHKHRDWLAARLARIPERVPIVPGAVILWRGEPYRLTHISCSSGPVQEIEQENGEKLLVFSGPSAGINARIAAFLRWQARKSLKEAVHRYATACTVTPSGITIRDTKSRWGSCSSRGALNFSWRLILAPPFVLDYLAAHEVAHLREMNHSSRYWSLLNALCPHVEKAERWLKQNGSDLHRYIWPDL